jgi:hypothetical protein
MIRTVQQAVSTVNTSKKIWEIMKPEKRGNAKSSTQAEYKGW